MANDQREPTQQTEGSIWADLLGLGAVAFGAYVVSKMSEELPPADPTGPPIATALQQYQAGNHTQGRQMLLTWIDKHPQDIEGLNQIAWELSIRRTDPDLAISIAEENVRA